MKTRTLGNSGLAIAGPLVFGGNIFGWTVDEPTAFELLDAFARAGFNCVDTADIYSTWVSGHQGGESETIIGNWLKRSGKRDQMIIATKVGMPMGSGRKGLSRANIMSAAEDSLRRLRTDRIDLYQAHEDDPKTPLEETLGAYADLIKQGKVRAIGASNYTADRLGEALEVSRTKGYPRYESLQPHYNLVERSDYEQALEPLCLKEHIGVIPYFSLASGFLTGKYRSKADLSQSARGSRVEKYLNDRGLRILGALDQVAQRFGSSPAAVSLAWLIARPSITAPIVSATNLNQLKDLEAATKLELDQGAIELLNQASA